MSRQIKKQFKVKTKLIIKIGCTNICYIQQVEIFAEKVQKYPCLYNKFGKEYKGKDRKVNALKAVEEELGMKEGIKIID